jgi:hypothetical protein
LQRAVREQEGHGARLTLRRGQPRLVIGTGYWLTMRVF